MQGRASPKYKGQYQAHPVNNWQSEFEFASQNGFSSIEFIIDLDQWEFNPLVSYKEINEVNKQIDLFNVNVTSVCCDFFMDVPFHAKSPKDITLAHEILTKIIECSAHINLTTLVIPCVDRSSFSNTKDIDKFVIEISSRLQELNKNNLRLSLETDLSPIDFKLLLDKLPDNVGVNYDTGNSAALGYDFIDEFKTYGSRINDIHLKDRKYGGQSVIFGTGDVDFPGLLYQINLLKYQGPIIMQAFRNEIGTDVLLTQLEYLRAQGW